MFTRREFGAMVAAGAVSPLVARPGLTAQSPAVDRNVVRGVRLGVISYSFRSFPRVPGIDYMQSIVDASAEVGGGDIELMARLTVQPQQGSREEIRQWRLTTPPSFFDDIRRKFAARGMRIISYTHTFSEDMTDRELDSMMVATKALGAGIMGLTMCKISAAARLAPLARSNDIVVAFHNRPESDDEVATPESFDRMLEVSDRFRINLDIGHFTAGNHEVLPALERFHSRISHIHLKDRRFGRNGGANLPWGQGDTPIREALQLVRDRKWPLSCIVEYEYQGQGTPIEEVKKCMAYARAALEA